MENFGLFLKPNIRTRQMGLKFYKKMRGKLLTLLLIYIFNTVDMAASSIKKSLHDNFMDANPENQCLITFNMENFSKLRIEGN